MSITFVIPLLTAFGLGSLLTAFLQHWFSVRSKKEARDFSERREAYIGLLEAYHRAAIEGTGEAAKTFAYWQMRCELVAPTDVRKAIADIIATNDDLPKRYIAHDKLKDAMRRDLKVSN